MALEGWWAASYLVLWFLVIVLSVVVVALARQIGTLHLRLGPRGALELDAEGPALGEAPEAITRTAIDGRAIDIGGPGRGQVIMFASITCHLCDQVMPSLHVAGRARGAHALVIVDSDEIETEIAFASKKVTAPVVAAADVAALYGVPGTPYVVVLDELGIVRAKGTVNNLEQLEGLIDTASDRSQQAGVQWSSTS